MRNHPVQFSLMGIAGVVFFVALGCVAMANASRVWAQVMCSLAVVLTFTSVLASMLSHGATRAFWLGVSVFGIGYFIASIGPLATSLQDKLVTTRFLDSTLPYLQEKFRASDVPRVDSIGMEATFFPNGDTGILIPGKDDFRVLGHSLCVFVFSMAGGFLGKYLHWRYSTEPDDVARI